MAVAAATSRARNDRLKLGVIPVLVAVLYFVLNSSGGDQPAASADATIKKPGKPQLASDANVPGTATDKSPPRARSVPQFPLAHILEHDPFALPSAFVRQPPAAALTEPEAAAATESTKVTRDDSPNRLAALQQRRVNMLLRDARGPAAVIGTKLVHVGDTLEDGVRVVAIDGDGVVLEMVTP